MSISWRRLYRTDKRVALFLDFHHIICDGHSIRIVAEDIIEAYRGSEIPGDAWTEIIGRSTVYGKAQREEDRKYFELGYGDKYDGDRYDQIPVFDKMEEGHRGEEEIYPFAFRKEEILQAAKHIKRGELLDFYRTHRASGLRRRKGLQTADPL